jgi:hypothetical protein
MESVLFLSRKESSAQAPAAAKRIEPHPTQIGFSKNTLLYQSIVFFMDEKRPEISAKSCQKTPVKRREHERFLLQ